MTVPCAPVELTCTRQGCPSRSGAVSARSHWMRHWCGKWGSAPGAVTNPLRAWRSQWSRAIPPSQRRRPCCRTSPSDARCRPTGACNWFSMTKIATATTAIRGPGCLGLGRTGRRPLGRPLAGHLRRSAGAPPAEPQQRPAESGAHTAVASLGQPVPVCAAVPRAVAEQERRHSGGSCRGRVPVPNVGYLARGAIIGELTGDEYTHFVQQACRVAGHATPSWGFVDGSDGGERGEL